MSLKPEQQTKLTGTYRDFDFEVGYSPVEIGYFVVLKPKRNFGIEPIVLTEANMSFTSDGTPCLPDDKRILSYYALPFVLRGYCLDDEDGLFEVINKKLGELGKKLGPKIKDGYSHKEEEN
jgi:hypothetical protein